MKHLFLSLALAFGVAVASAQIVPAENVAQAKKQAETKCKEGCLVLSPAEIAAIEMGIQEAIQRAYQEGLKGWSKAS